jgi:glucosyl-dolichyl phosphate glucuronosyltransferase
LKSKMSVVVVSFNRPEDVNETVASLLSQSEKPFEVIVIDDASTPPLKLRFQNENLRLIRLDQEVGVSKSRNYGIMSAKGDCMVFIDDDAIADKHWLEEVQNAISHDVKICGGSIKPLYKAVPPDWWNVQDFGGYVGVGNAEKGHIYGCNMIIKAEIFQRIGLFDTHLGRKSGKLFIYEEDDFLNRARRRGFKFSIIPTAIVYHKVSPRRMTIRYILRWNFYSGQTMQKRRSGPILKTRANMFLQLNLQLFRMVDPRIVFIKKSERIKKIAKLVWLIGALI